MNSLTTTNIATSCAAVENPLLGFDGTPTIYTNDVLSNEQYHAATHIVSSTRLKKILVTPGHYWFNESSSSASKSLGTAAHMAALEPSLYAQTYAVAPKFDKRTTAGREGVAQWIADHPGKIALEQDDADFIERMMCNIQKHDLFSALMKLRGQSELTVTWQDDVDHGGSSSPLLFKTRIDRVVSESPSIDADPTVIFDLKTTVDASKEAFGKQIDNYGYHVSSAMQRDGFERYFQCEPAEQFYCVVESGTGFVAVYPEHAETRSIGHMLYKKALRKLRECTKNQSWPAYQTGGSQEVSLPAYAIQKYRALLAA